MKDAVKFLKLFLMISLFVACMAAFDEVPDEHLDYAIAVIGQNLLTSSSIHNQVVSEDPEIRLKKFKNMSNEDKAVIINRMGAKAKDAAVDNDNYSLAYGFYVVKKKNGQAWPINIYIHGRWPGFSLLYQNNVKYEFLFTNGVKEQPLEANLELLLTSIRVKDFNANTACNYLQQIVSSPINVNQGGAVIEVKQQGAPGYNEDDKFKYVNQNQVYEFLKHGSADFWSVREFSFPEVATYEGVKHLEAGDLTEEARLIRMITDCFGDNKMNQVFNMQNNPNKNIIKGKYAAIFAHLVRYMKNEANMYNTFEQGIKGELEALTCAEMLQKDQFEVKGREFHINENAQNEKNPVTNCYAEYIAKQTIFEDIDFNWAGRVRRAVV